MNERFDKITPGLPAKVGLLVDGLWVCAALWLTVGQPFDVLLSPVMPVILLAWFVAAAILRLYSPCTQRNELDHLILGLLAATAVTIALAAGRVVLGHPLQIQVLIDFGLLVFAATTLGRVAVARPFWKQHDSGERVLIVGTGELGLETYRRLTSEKLSSTTVVGFLRLPGDPPAVPGARVLGPHDRLLTVLAAESVSEVYLAGLITEHGELMQELVRACEEVGVPFAVPLHSLAFQRATLLGSSLTHDGYLHYMNSHRSPIHYVLKRLADIALAGTALLLLSPLLLGVAVAIKLSSRGPVLFRQRRVGLHGAQFSFLKFRSMVVNAEELKAELIARAQRKSSSMYKMQADPRITRVGSFIRKYSIDELPQLVNILRGDMTIVGPRPALPEEVATYKPWQRRRLSIRPGLTCFWQVHDKANMSFDQWMRLDLEYVDKWSAWIDFKLITQTVPVVLFGRTVSNELYVWRNEG